jgi:hydroxymethylglutaryl-CoA lyase
MTAQLPQQFVPSNLPTEVSVCEVSARDGLQSQARTLPVSTRLELIRRLSEAGLKTIEAGSFVSPQAVPQMADTRSVLAGLDLDSDVAFPVLVPNQRGLDDAVAAGAKDVSVFISVTDSFSRPISAIRFRRPPIAASK